MTLSELKRYITIPSPHSISEDENRDKACLLYNNKGMYLYGFINIHGYWGPSFTAAGTHGALGGDYAELLSGLIPLELI